MLCFHLLLYHVMNFGFAYHDKFHSYLGWTIWVSRDPAMVASDVKVFWGMVIMPLCCCCGTNITGEETGCVTCGCC